MAVPVTALMRSTPRQLRRGYLQRPQPQHAVAAHRQFVGAQAQVSCNAPCRHPDSPRSPGFCSSSRS